MKKDLTKLMDLTKEDILDILNLADQMKKDLKLGKDHKVLAGKTLSLIFQRPSTRTRISFETGMYQLGGQALFLNMSDQAMFLNVVDIPFTPREPIQDTARTLSRYVDGIVFRAYNQEDVDALAKWSTVPVINGLSDFAHPCQTLADLMTIKDHMGALKDVRLAYVGDGNNVCNSLIVGSLLCGLKVSVAVPEGYDPHPDVLAFAKNITEKNPDDFLLTRSPKLAVQKANVLVTGKWTIRQEPDEAEYEFEYDIKDTFSDFQINNSILDLADPKAMVLHRLPAFRGDEISEEIFEAHASSIFDGVENRLHVQKAVMAILMGNQYRN